MSLHVLGPLRTQVKLPGQSGQLSGVSLVYTITVETSIHLLMARGS